MGQEMIKPVQQREKDSRYLVDMHMWQTDVRPGERRLMRSSAFAQYGLRLARNVKFSDMKCCSRFKTVAEQARKQRPDFVYDYLICKEDNAVLAICLEDREPGFREFMSLPGLTVMRSSEEAFSEGKVALIQNVLNRVAQQEQERGPNWQCPLRPCSKGLLSLLERQWLVESDPEEGLIPTDYGLLLGVTQVSWSGGTRVMCTPKTAQRLWKRFKEREQPEPAPPREEISLEERLQASRKGLFLHGQEAARLVREVMDIPLKEYMTGFTEALEAIKNALPDRSCRTYATAAQAIAGLLKSPDDKRQDTGMDLMLKLVSPLLEDDKIIRLGGRGLDIARRAPSYPAERYQKYWGWKPQSFLTQTADRASTTMAERLFRLPMTGFFQGVGLLAGSSYPQWLAESLTYQLGLKGRPRYIDLLWLGIERIRSEDLDFGLKLIYLLAIEPYCMIPAEEDNNLPHKERTETNNEL